MQINSIKKVRNLSTKTVLLRVNFDVPMAAGKIEDDYRIRASLETINFLLKQKCKLIIITHLGRPAGRRVAKYSVKPLAMYLSGLLKRPIKFIPKTVGPSVELAVQKLKAGDIIFLENLRFQIGELNDDDAFAQQLARLADLYVNDAFAVCHRKQASVSAIKDYLPSYAGLLLIKELTALDRVLRPVKPLVIVMGGAKTATKLPLIQKLYPQASHLLLGGVLANTFFKVQKQEIGRSLYDQDSLKLVSSFYTHKRLRAKIILPLDLVVEDRKGRAVIKELAAVVKSDNILDIGPATILKYSNYIKKAQTLVCNGPMGKFEDSRFKHGTMAIIQLVAARSTGRAYGVVGGGDIVRALHLSKMTKYVDWVSTAGGAMLTYLGGNDMPGLKKIIK